MKIKILNSETEARGLVGKLVANAKVRDGNDPIENLYNYFLGNFTPIQRLNSVIKEIAKKEKADYAVITDRYETIMNNSGYMQNIEDCNKFLTVKVNFYQK